jgi:hypothetical protein
MNRRVFAMTLALAGAASFAAEPRALPPGVVVESLPQDPAAKKIVLISGSNFYKAGEHEYVGNCAALADLLRQTPGVAPVLAVDWPKKPETLPGSAAVVFLFDGAEKHEALKSNRATEIQKLVDAGVGLVQLHQTADYPTSFGDRARAWAGAAFEKGYSQRAHWVATFDTFTNHPIFRGVEPFTIDDGWLWKHKFVSEKKGITPLLRTVNPKSKDDPNADAAIIAWAYDRPSGGRSFTFTGAHLHKSFAEAGYRRFLTNGVLWAAGVDVPKAGAPVSLDVATLEKYLTPPPKK